MYPLLTKKNRSLSSTHKKFQQFASNLASRGYSIQAQLRVLRSYRLKQLHQYCHDQI